MAEQLRLRPYNLALRVAPKQELRDDRLNFFGNVETFAQCGREIDHFVRRKKMSPTLHVDI